jgi:hypothetical protein
MRDRSGDRQGQLGDLLTMGKIFSSATPPPHDNRSLATAA